MELIYKQVSMNDVVFIDNYRDYIDFINKNNEYHKFTIIFMKNVFIPELIITSTNITRLIGIPPSSTIIDLRNCCLHGSIGNGYLHLVQNKNVIFENVN
jgi:hypothetical protein